MGSLLRVAQSSGRLLGPKSSQAIRFQPSDPPGAERLPVLVQECLYTTPISKQAKANTALEPEITAEQACTQTHRRLPCKGAIFSSLPDKKSSAVGAFPWGCVSKPLPAIRKPEADG